MRLSNSYFSAAPVCQSIPQTQCVDVPRKSCAPVARQVPKQVCNDVPRQNCVDVPRKECAPVSRPSCFTAHKQVETSFYSCFCYQCMIFCKLFDIEIRITENAFKDDSKIESIFLRFLELLRWSYWRKNGLSAVSIDFGCLC